MQARNFFLLTLLIHFPFGCNSKFWRRRWHSSVIARDWLYIDGGQVSFTQGNYVRQNSTIGIDLSKDWTNASLTPIYTERPPRLYARSSQALWFDNEKNVIYQFGGDNPVQDRSAPDPSDSIQGFTPDGAGGGHWTEVVGVVGEKPFPSDIHGTSSGMFTSDDKDAYYVGGFISERTSPSVRKGINLHHGFLKLNFGNITLTNSSSLGLSYFRGAFLNVPVYGSNGVLLAFGGSGDQGAVGFNIIDVFDKKEHKWYHQIAEGDIPRPRDLFCAVGVHEKENKSFEIIIHGGIVDQRMGPDGEKFDEVYVLSLPAFRWFSANSTSTSPRWAHTCHATTTRQMIMIGGTNPLYSFDYDANGDRGGEPQDPWEQGIAVFDMNTLKFKNSFQSRADPYEPPLVIQQYYNNSKSKYPSSWTSSAVKAIFEDKPPPVVLNTTKTTESSTASVSPTLASPQSPSRLGRGALVGVIVGCIIAALLSGVSIIYMIKKRRNRKKRNPEISAFDAVTPQDAANDQERHEVSSERALREIMNQHSDRAELTSSWIRPPVELN